MYIRIKKITLDSFIKLFMLLYILSLYLLTYKEGLNTICNALALALMVVIWINIILLRKKIVFNGLLLVYLLFIFICFISFFFALDKGTVVSKARTLFLIFLVMFSLVNYIDSYLKIEMIFRYFVFSGFVTSIYIVTSSDFSNITRFGSELGNVNAIGMIISLSSILCFYLILSKKKHLYVLAFLLMIPCILLTGSRKALLFFLINIITILFFRYRHSMSKMIRFAAVTLLIILVFSYLIFNVPLFYEVIGRRMENLFSFVTGEGTKEGSINTRAYMIRFGLEMFKQRPLFGYGIDNYRFLYGNTYSHNNFIELMVGTGVLGVLIFYLSHFLLLKRLYRTINMNGYAILSITFIAIILSYFALSTSLIYYDNKHFNYLIAIASTISIISKDWRCEVNHEKAMDHHGSPREIPDIVE